MVFLHVKRDNELQFYIETPAVTPVGKVAAQAAGMHNLIRRIQRICAEGAKFAEQVLQSAEPALDHTQNSVDPDDDTANVADCASSPQQQEAGAETAALPAQTSGASPPQGHPAAELSATNDSGCTAAAAALAADDDPEAAKPPQQADNASARLAASSTDLATAAASSDGRCNAESQLGMQTPDTDRTESTACEAAHAAAADAEPVAEHAAETVAAAPTTVSEADEQFEALCRALLAASQLIVTDRAAQRQLLTADELQAAIGAIQAAADGTCLGLAIGGDVFKRALADDSVPDEVQAIHADIVPDTAVLWVANRKLDNQKTLAAEVGRNDKTRVTVTVQHAKEPAPPKSMEPPPEEYDQMLAFYYKWQEKDKRLEADMDLGYYNSPWADPRSLKQSLSGVGGVTMPKHGPRGFN